MRQPIKRGRVMAEINITPFTDVVLVLLVIFMVTTPLFLQSGIKIKLPKAGAVETQSDKNLTVKINAAGQVFFNEKNIEFSKIERELTARASNNPELVVIINADKQIQYNEVIRVLDAVKKSGVKKLALGVEQQKN